MPARKPAERGPEPCPVVRTGEASAQMAPGSASRWRAIVIGGSLAGLSAACRLADLGMSVRIHERAAHPLEDRGAGIVLHPSTVDYLVSRRNRPLDEMSLAVRTLRYLDRSGGVVAESPARLRFASYGALHRELRAALSVQEYVPSSEVVRVEQAGEGAGVVLADGTREQADLVVCADGIGSTARAQLLPGASMSFSGYVAWRGVTDERALSAATQQALGGAITYTIMANSHLLTYPIAAAGAGGEEPALQRNWVWYRNVASAADLRSLLTDVEGRTGELSVRAGRVAPRHVAAMRADAERTLPEAVLEAVQSTDEPFIQVVGDLEPARVVVGRACLIGDAAFVARPHAAAGTAKACDDAARLAASLARAPDVPAALSAYEPEALRLGSRLVARSRRAGNRAQFERAWKVGEPLPFGLRRIGDSELD